MSGCGGCDTAQQAIVRGGHEITNRGVAWCQIVTPAWCVCMRYRSLHHGAAKRVIRAGTGNSEE